VAARDLLVNFMDNHDVPRFLFDKPSLPALHNALSFLFTEDGIPCLYYGTEQEFNGGNDPNNRERLWDTGFRTDGATFQWIQKLIRLRKAYAPLRYGALTIRWSTTHVAGEEDAGTFAFERSYNGHTILVVINTSDGGNSETSTEKSGGTAMKTAFAAGAELIDVLAAAGDANGKFTVGAAGTLTVPVAARSTRILVPQADVVPVQ
jgi:glycosidase